MSQHLFLHLQSARLECHGCGVTFGLSLPMRFAEFKRLAEGFEREHAACATPTKQPKAVSP